MVPLILLSLVSLTWALPDVLLGPDLLLETNLEPKQDIPDSDYRLSETTVPSKYDLLLNVPRECFEGKSKTYSGIVSVIFSVSEPKNTILINSLVNISSITATEYKSGQSVEVGGFYPNSTTQIVEIQFANNLIVDVDYELQINFTSQLINLIGFYTNEYLADGATEYLATTQFEPNYARLAFPCFDEPQYKAIFTLTLIHPSDFLAAANTPIADAQKNDETSMTTTVFEDTPIMSPYLLSFTISKYNCSTTTDSAIVHEVCTRRDFASQRELALEYGVKFLNALGTWTQLPYETLGISKMDQYSFPTFGAGAMENWGMVTYQEYALLYSAQDTSNRDKQEVLITIAHEFSHMWFGDYVTTKWWNSVFLNEGFAAYFQYFIFNQLPELTEFEMNKQFIIEGQVGALLSDADNSSSSLTSEPPSPIDIWNKFGAISYNKGASIIRMVENTVGSDRFKRILHNYLVQQ
ncbi:unnamed protein product [Diabrotica balteata]|uniref:Aminopeptidase N n=1 Tax=Diabrotica balteata TaxID=107213 RepID=A0A9P0DZ34_DIABA|nr:unnamed protein product [Diabrotica balteata]